MTVDLKQFHQVFIEESVEGLDAMESALMELDIENIDNEVINTIFRSAHSIKGGAGTFGFTALASFTHVLETLLDEVRSSVRGLSLEHVNLLLQSVDCMRELLELIQEDNNDYTTQAVEIQNSLEQVLAQGNSQSNDQASAVDDGEKDDSNQPPSSEIVWRVSFKPHKDLIRTGNDPLRIIRELDTLADKVMVDLEGDIPSLSNYCAEDCCFSWSIRLQGAAITNDVIMEAFEWVIDECDLVINAETENHSAEENSSSHGAGHGDHPNVKSLNNNSLNNNASHAGVWKIKFAPHAQLFQTGNDPLRIFSELDRSCNVLSCQLVPSDLPDFKLFDAEQCYLAWELEIEGNTPRKVIEEAFEWVVEEADIQIDKLSSQAQAQAIDVHPSGKLDSQLNSNNPIPSQLDNSVSPDVASQQVVSQSGQPTSDAAPANKVVQKSTTKSPKKSNSGEASSIRVGIDKVDSLINMVGELVITQSMLGQLGGDFDIKNLPKLIEGLNQLEQNTRELQESVMRIRMLPISFAFSRFPRMVRDLGQELKKKINLVLLGENTELDKTVMEKIGDPLVHLVRNSVDHGIETSEQRIEKGKPEEGTVTLNAYHQGGNVVIEIIDDGRGLDRNKIAEKGIERGLLTKLDEPNQTDEQIFDLIFQPGFSTAQAVSSLSGRGVGMDVVKRNIQALNGVVEIQSKYGEGTKIRISLPLTLAILDGQLVKVGSEIYIFPLVSIVESMQYREELVNHIAGGCNVFKLRDEYVPIVDLSESFGADPVSDYSTALMVVVECDGFKVAMVVNELMAQQQVVIKSLEQNYKRVEGISGATILGDGTVALIVDVPGVVRLAGADQQHQQQTLRKSA